MYTIGVISSLLDEGYMVFGLAGSGRKTGTRVDITVEYIAKQDVGHACCWMLGQHTFVL